MQSLLDTPEKRVAQWKFTQVDRNGDDWLSRSELGDLRRMVKKLVRPRHCAQLFSQHCDFDGDFAISRPEWATCLGLDSGHSGPAEGENRRRNKGGNNGQKERPPKQPPFTPRLPIKPDDEEDIEEDEEEEDDSEKGKVPSKRIAGSNNF